MLRKPPKIISKSIRQSANGEACTLRLPGCEHRGTVVLCHLNSRFSGMASKSLDIHAVYGCHSCHMLLDANKVSKEDQLRALFETQAKLIQKGLIQCKN
jgi:hypothetical protein